MRAASRCRACRARTDPCARRRRRRRPTDVEHVEREHALRERRALVPQPRPPRQQPFAARVLHPESRGGDRQLAARRQSAAVRDRKERNAVEVDPARCPGRHRTAGRRTGGRPRARRAPTALPARKSTPASARFDVGDGGVLCWARADAATTSNASTAQEEPAPPLARRMLTWHSGCWPVADAAKEA